MAIEFNRDGGNSERRYADRSNVRFEAKLRERGRSALNAQVETLSTHGCSASGYGFVHQGSYVWVRLPGLESLYGRIAWCHGMRAGIVFDQPLHPAVLARLVSDARSARKPPASKPDQATAIPLPANDEPLVRRDDTFNGIVGSPRSPLLKRKSKPNLGIADFINRRVTRQSNHRFEQRFADAASFGSTGLRIDGREARVLDVSASGIRLAVELEADIGDEVTVEFDGFETCAGRLVWRNNAQAGFSLPPDTIEPFDRTG